MVKVKTPKGTFEYFLSGRKDKKLAVLVDGHLIHFGQFPYEHYFDRTGLLDPSWNHLDKERRKRYLQRSLSIADKFGRFTSEDVLSPNYHSIHILW